MSGRSTARREVRGTRGTSTPVGEVSDSVSAAKAEPRVPTSEQLLAQYRRRPTDRLRDALLERHRAEVESIARALAARLPRSVEVEDLVHAGMWGLMQAIEKFRADRGSPFRPFMRPRVRGAMLDELRNLDFLPRLWRRRARALDQATTELRFTLGREPSDDELAQRLGTSQAWLTRARTRVHEGPIDSRNRFDSGADGDPLDAVADEHLANPIEQLDRQDLLAMIESSLQPMEWKVLEMHYFQGLSGKEVAQALHLSPARICQIHGTVLSRLKQRFAALAI